jgi:hypothetical protein
MTHETPLNIQVESLGVEIPFDSPEYQSFLEANKNRETAKEAHGGPHPEAEKRYLDAVQGLSNLAFSIFQANHSR